MAKKDKRFKYQEGEERPVTISLRIPQDLYDRLEGYRKRYPQTHRPSVSELVRDGIEMRLEEDADPRNRKAESTTEGEPQIDGASILRDMQATLTRHETQMEALMQAIEQQPPRRVIHNVIHGNTTSMDTTPAAQPTVVQAAQNPTLARVAGRPFDASKFCLGTLCPRRHDFGGTGQSLLRKHNHRCRECENEGKRAARAREKAAREAATG